MTKEKYTTRKGISQFRPVISAKTLDRNGLPDNEGFCLACGDSADYVEPDARRYVCDSCGQAKVYGLEELLLMGLLRVK